jgi:hypothetical protein
MSHEMSWTKSEMHPEGAARRQLCMYIQLFLRLPYAMGWGWAPPDLHAYIAALADIEILPMVGDRQAVGGGQCDHGGDVYGVAWAIQAFSSSGFCTARRPEPGCHYYPGYPGLRCPRL